MNTGQPSRSLLFVALPIATALLTLGLPAPAGAADAWAPSRLLSGPPLQETGQIAGVAPEGEPTSKEMQAAAPLAAPKEKPVAPAAAQVQQDAKLEPVPGVIPPRLLEPEIAANLSAVDTCRVEVARQKRVSPGSVLARSLLLRWTIQPDGSVGSTEVVATGPVDLGVMDCAKETMAAWTFTRPTGGAVRVERALRFRPLK